MSDPNDLASDIEQANRDTAIEKTRSAARMRLPLNAAIVAMILSRIARYTVAALNAKPASKNSKSKVSDASTEILLPQLPHHIWPWRSATQTLQQLPIHRHHRPSRLMPRKPCSTQTQARKQRNSRANWRFDQQKRHRQAIQTIATSQKSEAV